MDPSLLKEREAFLKRSKANPVVEKRKNKNDFHSKGKSAKRQKAAPPPSKPRVLSAPDSFNYKTAQATSQQRFSILAKIVKHMKERHKHGDTFPLTLEEILEETNQMDASVKIQNWLSTEALTNNPKIEAVEGDKFCFKPTYTVRDKKGLLKLLKNHDLKGLGGIFMDDIEESVPEAQKVLKVLGESVLYVTRGTDKKKVLYYNDRELQFSVDEEFQKLWRSVSVEGMDERKIGEYLDRQGINSMHDSSKKVVQAPKRKKVNRKNKNAKTLNEHLDGVLKDYSESATGIGGTKT